MPRTPAQNDVLRAATQEAIETAAVRVFARHGFAAASMRQIAAEAGLSIGSIYRHHASKEQLFEHLLAQASTGLVAAAERLAGEGPPLALVRDFTTTFLDDLAGEHGGREFFLVINQAVLTDTPPGAARRLARAQRSLWSAFAQLVRRGQGSGEFASGDAEQTTAHYCAMLSGIATMRQVMGDGADAPDVDIVLRLLTGGQHP
ncbi:TetR/AcrR family transcriptional regulator [Brachybacterium phenoliresistens]|uniref:TetR family transcriptional regulator n=1 Tax=Brachybacterium phenoliresistens TaxID=396014 RepID=Z9JVZ6_9MICO|nr:TetR/AcrR family transcriptional regulator [Brachybacterium phenoliresistens]EWS82515.1 TetR family transcriptional regulator [Brachybacterium phenoliresistens]